MYKKIVESIKEMVEQQEIERSICEPVVSTWFERTQEVWAGHIAM